MTRRLIAAAVLLMALVAAGCSSSDEGDAASVQAETASLDGGSAGSGGGDPLTAQRALADDGGADDSATATETNAYLAGAISERVIKTADLQLEVADGDLAGALRGGREIAEAAGGFVLSTSVDGTDRRRGSFTIRVPAERFEETLSELEALGSVAGEDVRGEDVSQEFVDLEARLRNATAQEQVLFRLYDRSNTIADTIRVQRELEDVQLEIERLRGRLRFLEDRTDLSTISVSVTESGAVTAEPGPFARAWDKARDTFVAVVSGAIVGAGFLAPLVVLALLAYLVFRLVRPRLSRATS